MGKSGTMKHRIVEVGILLMVMLSGAACVSASAPEASSPPTHSSETGQAVAAIPGWQQVNVNGFGDPQTDEVTALEAFNGYLYAGIHNPVDPEPLFDGARIYRSATGETWTAVTQPGFAIAHDIAPPAILDLAVFNTRLYASTGRGDGPGQIWRTQTGTIWSPMVIDGFGDPDNVDITALAVYNSLLYAGVTNLTGGAQIWRSSSGDNNTWSQVAFGMTGTAAASISDFIEFGGALYAAVESDGPVQIWQSTGGNWTAVVSDGFGDDQTLMSGGMAVYGGYLYVGVGNDASGAQLMRSNDGMTWNPAISPGFDDPNNTRVDLVFGFQNQLYAGVHNAVTGIELWTTADGSLWEPANLDGFEDSHNSGTNESNAAADFLNHFYVGTANSFAGGELWRMQQAYGVVLSNDDTHAGAAGTTVIYNLTVSNSGDVDDTFSLAAAGSTWPALLSTSSISLPPGASGDFSVSVSIPAGAAGGDSDAVTITATSQGDPTKTDSAVLRTAVTTGFAVVLSADQNAQGSAGQTLSYTLEITNSGNSPDTFNLGSSGNLWATQVLPASVSLPAGAAGSFQVQVTIPAGALGTESDAATITATSRADPTKSDTAQIVTTVTPFYGVTLSPGSAQSGPAGSQVIYSLTITNTGNLSDSFTLAATGQAWSTALSAAQVSLAPAASTVFTVTVTIPSGAANNASDTVSITAASQNDASQSSSAVLTTTVSPSSLLSSLFLPVVTVPGVPGG